MDINTGEYVRTKNGLIAKAISSEYEYKDDYKQDFDNEILNDWYNDEIIVKHSPNIIDLIEVGDVLKLKEDNCIFYIGLEKDETTITYFEIKEDIKKGKIELLAIVTKEQFKNVMYEV